MAKVLLLSLSEEDPRDKSYRRGAYIRLKQSAEMGKSRHRLVDDPAEADIILFAETHFMFAFRNRRHSYYKDFRDKCFGFAIADYLLPFLPGVYPSIEKRWYSPRRVRSGFYLSILENAFAEFDPTPVERDLLYCFVGSIRTAPIRAQLAKLRHPRGLFIDTSQESLSILHSGSDDQRNAFWKRYADDVRRSKFVLCPRGEGTSSIRLFETMKMGRAPVIISDGWVPPEGPRWEQFSIRIAQKDAMKIPKILEEREGEAEAMGLKARQEWERWFSPEASFNTVIDWCLEIRNSRRLPEYLACLCVYPQILRWPFCHAYLRRWRSFFFPKKPQQK